MLATLVKTLYSVALARACRAPLVSKSGKSLDRLPTERTTVRPHHRETKVYFQCLLSHFQLTVI